MHYTVSLNKKKEYEVACPTFLISPSKRITTFPQSTTTPPIKTATRKELIEPTQVRVVTARGHGVIEHSKVFEKRSESSSRMLSIN
uniref:Uncharacterized protein n=1 Tax=Timema cristinae TaxID=61476 RepID=A0A7R9D2F2_TIMCR|nr:unnamed protein product [Timema cristinae]